jgi:hypothetical protein
MLPQIIAQSIGEVGRDQGPVEVDDMYGTCKLTGHPCCVRTILRENYDLAVAQHMLGFGPDSKVHRERVCH